MQQPKVLEKHESNASDETACYALTLALPSELLERIFILSGNENLHLVNAQFYAISKSQFVKAKWLKCKYGSYHVLSHMWKWRFTRQARDLTDEVIQCKCGKATKQSIFKKSRNVYDKMHECSIERHQIDLVEILLELGASLHAGHDMALKMAARFNHLKLCKYLLKVGADPNATVSYKRSWLKKTPRLGGDYIQTPQQQIAQAKAKISVKRLSTDRINLLLQACKFANIPLTTLLLQSGPSPRVLTQCLECTVSQNNTSLTKLLVEHGALSTLAMTQSILQRASTLRLTLGIKDKFSFVIRSCILALSDSDFERASGTIVRQCAEIGTVDGIKACVERNADVNVWEGLALYSAVYSGNYEVVEYLLTIESLNIGYFNWKKKFFCTVLMFIELLALGMFVVCFQ